MNVNRRRFLKSTAAGVAGAAVLGSHGVTIASPYFAADPVKLAIIGIGGRGFENITELRRETQSDPSIVQVTALCDVDSGSHSSRGRQTYPQAFFTDDYKRIIDRNDVEAVLIATPDHTHAVIAAAAIKAGKHVYCEKPLAHDVHEVRTLIDLAQRHNTVTQMGTQIHAGNNYRRVVEIVQAGTLGEIRRVKVWQNNRVQRPGILGQPNATPPSTLNYDLWLGPVAQRPYSATYHPFNWRYWWDFGGGILSDMACHYMDLPHWALNLRRPTSIVAQGRVNYQADSFVPSQLQVDYQYAARENLPPVHLTWCHGTGGADLSGQETYRGFRGTANLTAGVLFEGDKGKLIADYNNLRLMPEDRFTGFQAPTPTIPNSVGHHKEWLQAIRTGGPTTCNFAYSGPLAETVQLGNVAYRCGTPLEYDGATGRVTNCPAAEQYLKCEYRKGWTL